MISNIVKKAVRWNQLSHTDQDRYRREFERQKFRVMGLIARVVSVFPLPITTFLELSGSDKHQPRQKNRHQYGFAYTRAFADYRFKKIKILEIGIGGYGYRIGGESLLAWRAIFPFASILAADIEPKPDIKIPGVSVFQIDQSDKSGLDNFAKENGPFKIIIDDGSHMSMHQILTFKTLFRHLSDGGVYVIEDVETSCWTHDGWDGSPVQSELFSNTCVGYFSKLAKYVSVRNNFESLEQTDIEIVSNTISVYFERNLIIINKRG